jgi:hypothetical protein
MSPGKCRSSSNTTNCPQNTAHSPKGTLTSIHKHPRSPTGRRGGEEAEGGGSRGGGGGPANAGRGGDYDITDSDSDESHTSDLFARGHVQVYVPAAMYTHIDTHISSD